MMTFGSWADTSGRTRQPTDVSGDFLKVAIPVLPKIAVELAKAAAGVVAGPGAVAVVPTLLAGALGALSASLIMILFEHIKGRSSANRKLDALLDSPLK